MEFLVIIGLAVWIFTLSKRVSKLEERLKGGQVNQNVVPTSIPDHNYGGDVTRPLVASHAMSTPETMDPNSVQVGEVAFTPHVVESDKPSGLENFVTWVKQDFMVKLGAFLLLIAFGWFVRYAFANDWIGEMGRIMLGLVFGASIMTLGMWRIKTHPHQGGIFLVLGSTGIILTLYAARELYDIFTPETALLMMFLSVALVSFVSVRYDRKKLAGASLILAGIAPLLTASYSPSVTDLSLYLLVIVLGTLWVVYLRGWSVLTFIALVIVFLHHLPFLLFSGEKGLLFVYLFAAIFFIANILGLIKANQMGEKHKSHLLVAVGTGIYLIPWILIVASSSWQSMILVAWMLIFSVGSFITYRVLESKTPFYIYGGTGIAFLAAATAVELSGPALTIAYTFEILALVILASRLFAGTRVAVNLSWLFLGPILFSFESMDSSAWRDGVFHSDFTVLVVLTLSLLFVGLNFLINKNEHNQTASSVFITLGFVYVLILIWLVLHAGTGTAFGNNYDPTKYERGTMYSLVIYTIIGIYMYIKGTGMGKRGLALGGSILLGLVIARLLFVEVWNMEITGRIITFLIIGILLISTAFIKRTQSPKEVAKTEVIDNNN